MADGQPPRMFSFAAEPPQLQLPSAALSSPKRHRLGLGKTDVDNINGPVWQQASVRAERPPLALAAPSAQPMHTTQEGAVYVPPAAEVLTYDPDGNLTSDGR